MPRHGSIRSLLIMAARWGRKASFASHAASPSGPSAYPHCRSHDSLSRVSAKLISLVISLPFVGVEDGRLIGRDARALGPSALLERGGILHPKLGLCRLSGLFRGSGAGFARRPVGMDRST